MAGLSLVRYIWVFGGCCTCKVVKSLRHFVRQHSPRKNVIVLGNTKLHELYIKMVKKDETVVFWQS